MDMSEFKEALVRIDERTVAILDNQKKMYEDFERHEDQDKTDFKETNARVASVERKQTWILGIGTALVFVITVFGGIVKGIFGGM